MYGGVPGYKTAVTIRAKIVAVQQIQTAAAVSYNGEFVAPKPMTIGIVSCGYAHAGFLLFEKITHIYIDGIPCKILGRVCMDNFTVDVGGLKNPLGKVITIVGDVSGCTLNDYLNVIDYTTARILCSIKSST
jgi:alanine racemase